MSSVASDTLEPGAPVPGAPAVPVSAPRPRRNDFFYYGLRNKKLVFGLSLEIVLVLLAIIGPMISPHNATDFFKLNAGPAGANWFGTDFQGHDVFAQLVNGLRE